MNRIKILLSCSFFLFCTSVLMAQPTDLGRVKCDKCDGQGILTVRTTCNFCTNGYTDCPNSKCESGLVACSSCNGIRQRVSPCSYCEGAGKIEGVICSNCKGNGQVLEVCPDCKGMGFFDCTICDGAGEFKCTNCYGLGYREVSHDCDRCEGTGKVPGPGLK